MTGFLFFCIAAQIQTTKKLKNESENCDPEERKTKRNLS